MSEWIDNKPIQFNIRDPLQSQSPFVEQRLKDQFPEAQINIRCTGEHLDGYTCGQWVAFWMVIALAKSPSAIFDVNNESPYEVLPDQWEHLCWAILSLIRFSTDAQAHEFSVFDIELDVILRESLNGGASLQVDEMIGKIKQIFKKMQQKLGSLNIIF